MTVGTSSVSLLAARTWSARPFASHAGWITLVALVSAPVLVPIVALFVLAAEPTNGLWSHILANVLPHAMQTTVLLLIGVGLVTTVIGVGTAWLVTMCRFPGRTVFEWLLLLPLAMPGYVSAYCYVELLDAVGPMQSGLRALFGWRSRADYWFPEIRTLGGAIFVLGLTLFPYVYLTVRASFLTQSACALEVSRTLGQSAWGTFRKVALPLSRPAIAAGAALALLEALNDLGAAQFFGVNTLTVSVYSTWLHRGSLAGAAQIACVMLAVAFILLALERLGRRRRRYFPGANRQRPHPGIVLGPIAAGVAVAACAAPVLLGFVLPASWLAGAASRRVHEAFGAEYLALATRSLALAFAAALVTVALGLILAYGQRILRHPIASGAARLASLGYAVPGTVLAIGILYPFASFDNALDTFARSSFGISTGLILTGTSLALIFAYAVRFLAVAHGAAETGFGRVKPHLDMAARSLGRTATGTLREVHLPLLRPAIATAALLVFVDVMKELPTTLLLRPFNFETLATFVYGAASRESFEDGAIAALTLVVAGLVPVILLARTARVPVSFEAGRVLGLRSPSKER